MSPRPFALAPPRTFRAGAKSDVRGQDGRSVEVREAAEQARLRTSDESPAAHPLAVVTGACSMEPTRRWHFQLRERSGRRAGGPNEVGLYLRTQIRGTRVWRS